MKKIALAGIGVMIITVITMGCNGNRLPPDPVEQDRPKIVELVTPSDSAFAVDIQTPITLQFSEPMDPKTFPQNFSLWIVPDSITTEGSFQADGNRITFTPKQHLETAREYDITLLGHAKDRHGNSISINPEFRKDWEFITGGTYSEGGFQKVLAIDPGASKIYPIDGLKSSEALTQFKSPTSIAFNASGNEFFVASNSADKVLRGYSLANPSTVLDSFEVGMLQAAMCRSGNYLYVLSLGSATIKEIDLSNKTVQSIPLGAGVVSTSMASTTDRKVYTTDFVDGSVRIYDFSTGSASGKIGSVVPARTRIIGIATNPVDQKIYVLDYTTGEIKEIDGNQVSKTIALDAGTKPLDISIAEDGMAYVSTEKGKVYRVDVASGEIKDAYDFGDKMGGLAVTPKDELLYVVRSRLAQVVVMLPYSMRPVRKIQLSGTLQDVFIQPR